MISDCLVFVKELSRSFGQIGAMLPSSPALAKLMVRPIVKRNKKPLTILEVGPGTGPFTRQILKRMKLSDVFVICEINSRFISRLKKTLEENVYYQKHKSRVFFFEGSIEDLPYSDLPTRFDVIVSSLPFVNFPSDLVGRILHLFEKMMLPGASLTFVQYVGVCRFRRVFSTNKGRQRIKQVERIISDWCDNMQLKGSVEKSVSFLNVPPAMSVEVKRW